MICQFPRLSILLCVFALDWFAAFAQAPIGAIAGTVTDESGGVVAGATVTITNKATGLKRKLKSESEGAFSAPALRSGEYEVRGHMPGFRQIVRDAEVVTGSTTTVGLQMAVGAVAEVVNVAPGPRAV